MPSFNPRIWLRDWLNKPSRTEIAKQQTRAIQHAAELEAAKLGLMRRCARIHLNAQSKTDAQYPLSEALVPCSKGGEFV